MLQFAGTRRHNRSLGVGEALYWQGKVCMLGFLLHNEQASGSTVSVRVR